MSTKAPNTFAETRGEVTAWFFEDYLPRWVAAGSGASGEGPDFILEYWDVPMHVAALGKNFWCLESKDVLAFLEMNQGPLKAAGYTHTVVPDRRVFVYSSAGAAIEVIWSRRRADESEIQRLAVHFEIAKGPKGWRMVGIQALTLDIDMNPPCLADVWPR